MDPFKRRLSLNRIRVFFILCFVLASLFACKPKLTIENVQIKIDEHIEPDQDLTKLVLPYSVEMNSQMNVKIAESHHDFIVSKPGSNLMNWMADAVFANQTKSIRLNAPTFCLLNTGGIRSSIGKGDVKLKDLFQVMPFDNSIVWVKLPMSSLNEISAYLNNSGGEPISNITMREGKILLNMPAKRKTNFFWVITSDYLYQGGDHMSFFEKSIELVETNTLIRDALIEEAKIQKVLENDTTTRIR